MLTLILIALVFAAGWAVDHYVFKGEFLRLTIAEIRWFMEGRRRDDAESDVQKPADGFGRRR